MFETLDDAVFIGTPSTYGPADDAPRLLRELADDDPVVAARALYWIEASYFHQDQYCPATARIVPYLLELLSHDLSNAPELMSLLGRMLRGYHDDGLHGGPLRSIDDFEGDEADTLRAVHRGRAVLEASLQSPSIELRSATIWTLSALRPPPIELLALRLEVERDPRVRVMLRVALGGLGASVPAPPDDATELERDAARIVGAVTLDDDTYASYIRFLYARSCTWLHFSAGEPWWWALERLSGVDDPRVVPLLLEAAQHRPAEGVALWPGDDREPDANFEERVRWLLNERLFPTGVPRRAQDLNDTQRRVMCDVWIGEMRGVRVTHGDLEAQRAFVRGDGPLDDSLELGGISRTVAEHLLESPDRLEDVLAAHRVARGAQRSFELALALVRSDLNYGEAQCARVARTCTDVVTPERTLAYLAAPESSSFGDTILLLEPYLQRGEPAPEVLAPYTVRRLTWDSCKPEARAWFRTFPAAQRARLAAQIRLARYWSLCDRAELGRAIMDQVEIAWLDGALEIVPQAILEAAAQDPDEARRACVERQLQHRRETMEMDLSARTLFARELELRSPNGVVAQLMVETLHTPADLAPLFDVLHERAHARLAIYPSVPDWITQTLRAELGERVHLRSA
jgi:hypothetical protein